MSTYQTRLSAMFKPEALRKKQLLVINEVMRSQVSAGLIPNWSVDHLPTDVPESRYEHLAALYRHETAGWVAAWREQLPQAAQPYGYLGLTSSNLIDTAMAMAATEFTHQINDLVAEQEDTIEELLHHVRGWVREGRTHGQIATPVPVATTYARFWEQLQRGVLYLDIMIPPGALGGPTGVPVESAINSDVCEQVSLRLGVEIESIPTQVANRQRWLDWAFQLYRIIATCEQLATYHRLEAINGVDRFKEKFEEGVQRGSSSMPHKSNPIRSERICGLARVARGHLHALMETATTGWWERDLTNSSVEKTALADLVHLCGFILNETLEVLGSMKLARVDKDGLDPRAWSHHVMTSLQLRGMDHNLAYRETQEKLNDYKMFSDIWKQAQTNEEEVEE